MTHNSVKIGFVNLVADEKNLWTIINSQEKIKGEN